MMQRMGMLYFAATMASIMALEIGTAIWGEVSSS